MATEFVEMILTQKGFQANGKVVTTSDEILKMLNQMKR
jgi:flagellar hook protein FlgE